MIPGTGPGRGVPWWRWVLVLRIHHEHGTDRSRHGRVIAVVRKPR